MISDVVIMNVVMIYDMKSDSVLLQNRTKKWKGGCFPGGHLEDGETINASAVREIFEETGLTVKNLVPCGYVHWNKAPDRNEIIFCYRTSDFSGELKQCEEGENYWVKREELLSQPLTRWFRDQLPIFFGSGYIEFSHVHSEEAGGYTVKFDTSGLLPEPGFIPEFCTFPENAAGGSGKNDKGERV